MIFQKLCPDQSGVSVYVPTPLFQMTLENEVYDILIHWSIYIFKSGEIKKSISCDSQPTGAAN